MGHGIYEQHLALDRRHIQLVGFQESFYRGMDCRQHKNGLQVPTKRNFTEVAQYLAEATHHAHTKPSQHWEHPIKAQPPSPQSSEARMA